MMVHSLRVPIIVGAIASAFAGMAAAPAQADQSQYLGQLQPKYVYLSPQQLFTEGYRTCAARASGRNSTEAINMVQQDLAVSVATAADIVSTAIVRLC